MVLEYVNLSSLTYYDVSKVATVHIDFLRYFEMADYCDRYILCYKEIVAEVGCRINIEGMIHLHEV